MSQVVLGTTVFSLENEEALTNLVMNTILTQNSTASVAEAEIVRLCRLCSPKYVAELAKKAYTIGKMRSGSALLTAYLTLYPAYIRETAPIVLNNIGQIRKFIYYIDSNIVGKRTPGHPARRHIQEYFSCLTPSELFNESIGKKPSLANIIRKLHIKPTSEQEEIFRYLLGYTVENSKLPVEVRAYQAFLTGTLGSDVLPVAVTARLQPMLGKMTNDQKRSYVTALTPNQTRKELNLLHRNKVLESEDIVNMVVEKLQALRHLKNISLPFSLYISLKNISNLPLKIKKILATEIQDLLILAALDLNAQINRPITLAIDASGSMFSQISQANTQESVSAFEVACLFAYPLVFNPNVNLGLVDNKYKNVGRVPEGITLNQFMQAMKREAGAGTTALSEVLKHTSTPDTLILSDNESWADDQLLASYWFQRTNNPDFEDSRLILWDVQPNRKTPALTETSVLNMSGLSELSYNIINEFLSRKASFVDQILGDTND